MQPAELVACAAVHHSRATAIEGRFRLFETQIAASAAAGTGADADDPVMFSDCSWVPATGALVRDRAKHGHTDKHRAGRRVAHGTRQ